MTNFRIGLTGSGSSGKSSLAVELSKALEIPFVSSVSRSVFEARGLKESDQHNLTPVERFSLQKDIFAAYRSNLWTYITDGNGFVADRTAIDHMCYMLYRCNDIITQADIESIEEFTRFNLSQFDLIVFCPSGVVPLIDDGFREVKIGYQYLMDIAMRGLLEKMNKTYITAPLGSLEWRVDYIKNYLEQ